ncbi:hypothetical protein [Brevundimonas variabilis]|uniref:Uncharacterized protein n=1 Tax=Brevundimonas variabilis TaxID=74312 RepID=A0A7W9FGP5_9CAUL|nr:hypothetical protein [Brevundimonas variabilis]MBB5746863.1 hypothetical protein [Brevundimonas variabilis]
MKMTSDAALITGPDLLRMYGSWSQMLAHGDVRPDGTIVIKSRPKTVRTSVPARRADI